MIIGVQIIGIIFSFIMIYFAYLHYSRGEISIGENLTWWVIWVATIFLIIFPDLLRDFSQKVLITRAFDLMVIGGFILVITIIFKVYIKVKQLEKKMERLTRNDALKGERNDKKKAS